VISRWFFDSDSFGGCWRNVSRLFPGDKN